MDETQTELPHDDLVQEKSWFFPRIWAGFLCLLIVSTHRLWFVQNDVPPVAMFGWVERLPEFFGWIPVAAMLVGGGLVMCRSQKSWLLIAIGLIFAFALDQHRLQPWAYQSAIYALVFALVPPRAARRLLIPFAASIYIYSAAGKIDFQFAHSVGQDFLDVLIEPLGLNSTFAASERVKIALCFPVIELLAGLLLLPLATRLYAAGALIAMHVSLLLILGPLGLNHSNGVLIWNVALAVQAYFLFVAKDLNFNTSPKYQNTRAQTFAKCVVLIALIAPVTERFGIWDHWTSWALYSPHNSRVDVEIHRSALDVLPNQVRECISGDEDGDGWQSLALDDWSLRSLSVPVYPQARYQLALVDKLAMQSEMTETAIRCRLREMSDRFSGQREEHLLLGTKEIRRALQDYSIVAK